MRKTMHAALLSCSIALATACAAEPTTNRPSGWAQPLHVEGVPNLHKVSDVLYRSAQPTALGMRALRKMGIKTVVNLRSFHDDRDELAGVQMRYEHIYMKAWHPEKEDVIRFLRIVNDPERAPVLVHCQHGADRTGAMCALYRIAVQGWSREEALREMTTGGFGFHAIFKNLPGWIRDVDIEQIKAESAGGPNSVRNATKRAN